MKKALLLPLFLSVLLLSGCMSSQVEEQLLVIVMGLDTAESGDIQMTIKVPSNTAGGHDASSSDEAEKGGNQMGYLTLCATGHRFADTLELLLATTPRSLNFSQVREIVISRKLAESSHFSLLLQQLYTLPRMRTQAVVVICEEEASQFVEEQKPYVGQRLSRYIEVSINNYAGKGFVPVTTLTDAVKEMAYGWMDPLLILGAAPGEEAQAAHGGNVLDVDAGALKATSVNAVKLFGAAATDGRQVCGTLTGYEMALINLIRGNVHSLSLQDDQGFPLPVYVPSPATLSLSGREEMTLHVSLVCEVHYTSGYAPDARALEERLSAEIEQTIHKMQQMGCDGLGFGNLAVRRFLTLAEWENFNFREKYRHALVDAHVQIRLKKE